MISLEKMIPHQISESGYITSVNGMVHPDRILTEHDFLYILSGTWEVFEGENAYELESDSLLILAAGRHHYGRQLCSPGNRHMYIHVRPTFKELALEEADFGRSDFEAGAFGEQNFAEGAAMDNPESILRFPSHIRCSANPHIRRLFHEIIELEWTDAPERNDQRSLLFSLLLCEISNLLHSQDHFQTDPVLNSVCQKVRSTPHTFFSADDMGAEHGISGRTLNNRFSRTYGKTFYAWQMETHLEMARQFLLSQPQTKLSETALNFGFYDEFHFSKTFRKYYGQPPSVFRREQGISIVKS